MIHCTILHACRPINKHRSVCTYEIRSSAKSVLTFQYPSKPTADNTYYHLPNNLQLVLIGQAFGMAKCKSKLQHAFQ